MSEWKTISADVFCDSVRDGTHDTPKQVEKGYKLVEHCQNNRWKAYGSVSELFESQSMDLHGLFL